MPILNIGDQPGEGAILCGTWLDLTGDDPEDAQWLCSGCTVENLTGAVVAVASSLLYMASGRQFPGLCEDKVRPCIGTGPCQYLAYPDGYARAARPVTVAQGGSWVPLTVCGCGGDQVCTSGALRLPQRPVQTVVQVRVDGEVLDASEYRLANQGDLLRVDGSWPCSQDLALADTEPGTWSVTYRYGTRPDPGGLWAVGALACEIARACNDDDECRLPKRIQEVVREGVRTVVLDPFDFLGGEGPTRFGLWETDSWLDVVNPLGAQRPASVLHPSLLGEQSRS